MTRSADDENFACTRGVIRSTRFGCRACARRRAGFGVGTPLPRGRVEADLQFAPRRKLPRHGLLASARFGPSGLRNPGSIRASDAATRLAGRAANTMTAGRRVSTRTAHRHLTFCERETSAFASAAVRLALLSRDRGLLHRHGAVSERRSPLCRICLRDHPRAPPCFTLDPRWVHTALGQVRCEPVCMRAAERFLRLFCRPATIRGSKPLSVVPASASRGPDAYAEHLVVAPAWPTVRRYRGPARQLFAGAEPALARFSRCFRVARGRLLHLAVKSSPATRTHPVVPPREGSTPPDKSEVLSAAPRSGERALPVALPDGVGVGARCAFVTRQNLAP
jgi:hypothetical protein